MKKIILSKEKPISFSDFSTAQDNIPILQKTEVELSYDDHYLYVKFACLNDPWVDTNTYKKDNTDMWNQEVFEMFITDKTEHPDEYIEIEINPNNALFLKRVKNPELSGIREASFIDTTTSNIERHTQKEEGAWRGSLKIPLEFLSMSGEKKALFRANFYRVIATQKPDKSDWICGAENAIFACWSSTESGAVPQFHISHKFGLLELN